jgi:O-antigen/teichoic acid export membrane protein
VPLTALLILRRAVTLGIKHIVSSQLPESLVRPAIFTALLALAYLAIREVSAFDAMALNVVSVVVALAVGLWLLWRQLPDELRHGPPTYETGKWVHEAVPFALAAAAQTLMNQTDVILVGALAGPAQAGLYAVASRGASLTLFGAMAVGTTLMPTAAQLWAHDDYARLQRVVTRAARGAFLFALAVALVLWIFGPQFLLLFGKEFVAANATLAVLAFASVIDCGFGISGLMLSMTGYQGLNFAAMAAAVVTRIALGLLLIPVLGAVGAAVAAVVAITVVNVLATWYAARRLGLDATPLGIARFSRR